MFAWYAALARRVSPSLLSSTIAVLPAAALRAPALLDAVVCSDKMKAGQADACLNTSCAAVLSSMLCSKHLLHASHLARITLH